MRLSWNQRLNLCMTKDKPRPIPGFALDKGKADFYENGAKLNNKAPIRDPYEARAIAGDLEVERRERRD
jgi:hypothetical protein